MGSAHHFLYWRSEIMLVYTYGMQYHAAKVASSPMHSAIRPFAGAA